MPNHITTVATVTGPAERADAFRLTHIKSRKDGHEFDFDTIIPMPVCVKATIRDCKPGGGPSFGDHDVEMYAKALLGNRSLFLLAHERPRWMPESAKTWADLIEWYDEHRPGLDKVAKTHLLSAAETGYPSWYEWSCANWGTKWGSYRYEERAVEPGRFVFAFETAWSPPRPILAKLAELWPELRIETKSIDEGGGA